MLRCAIADIKSGMIVGSPVTHPNRADIELLSSNVQLDDRMITRLTELGIEQLWIHHDATKDLDLIVSPKLSEARRAVYNQLKKDVSRMAMQSVSTVQIDTYTHAVQSLVYQLVNNGKIADLTELLFDSEAELFSHASNVAYLSLLLGLELQTYIFEQRKWLSYERSRDLTNLGLGAMMHDIGKTTSKDFPQLPNIHEALDSDTDDPELVRAYTGHVMAGHKLLNNSSISASARQVVINHHQRYNGSGWPNEDNNHKVQHTETQIGNNIFIYCRIVAVANVLDNLLRSAEGYKRPPVAALYELQSEKFEGWFDPVVQHTALRRLPPFPMGSQVTLSDGSSAVVISPNLKSPCRPMLRLLDESLRTEQGKYPTLNLQASPQLHIESCGGINVEKWLYEIPDEPLLNCEGSSSYDSPELSPRQKTPPQEVMQQVSNKNKPQNKNSDRRSLERENTTVVVNLTLEEIVGTTILTRDIEIATRDISPGGFGFIHNEPLVPDTLVHAYFGSLPNAPVLTGMIRNCHHLGGNQYRIGIEFLQMKETKTTLAEPHTAASTN